MRFNSIILIIVCLILNGCGPSIIPIETASVSGVAKFEGKPLENYRVFFYCEAAEASEPATGLIKKDGTFTLTVRNPGDGGIVGSNKVWFTYDPPIEEEVPGLESGKAPPPPSVKLPQKFQSAATSGLTVDIPKSGLKDYALELK
jgi:hypothetical protein